MRLASAVAICISPFNPVSEIIAELSAVATWLGQHTNSSQGLAKGNHVNAVIASYARGHSGP
jgi:hypothetical protein